MGTAKVAARGKGQRRFVAFVREERSGCMAVYASNVAEAEQKAQRYLDKHGITGKVDVTYRDTSAWCGASLD